jgi:hypothetical protein
MTGVTHSAATIWAGLDLIRRFAGSYRAAAQTAGGSAMTLLGRHTHAASLLSTGPRASDVSRTHPPPRHPKPLDRDVQAEGEVRWVRCVSPASARSPFSFTLLRSARRRWVGDVSPAALTRHGFTHTPCSNAAGRAEAAWHVGVGNGGVFAEGSRRGRVGGGAGGSARAHLRGGHQVAV